MKTVTCAYCGSDYSATEVVCLACGMVASGSERALPVGTVLHGGKFAIGRVLGEGGFGITYKGAHKYLRRPVAIKELFPESAVRMGKSVSIKTGRQEEFKREIQSILQEARVIASLNAPGIVDVHDMFRENGTAYVVMEFLAGPTLQEKIDSAGPLPSDEVLAVALAMCEALAAVHAGNLLHRDVKPANIVLAEDGRIVLIDFGSAREFQSNQTRRHTRLLTPEFASPEQFSGKARFGPATDIYCLGATLFAALTGAPPPGALERLQSSHQGIDFPVGLQGPLCDAIAQALNLRVADRPQTIEEFRDCLGSGQDLHPSQKLSPVHEGRPNARLGQSDTLEEADRDNPEPEAEITGAHDDGLIDGLIADPSDAVTFYNRGIANQELGRHAEAIADYDQALRLDPNYAPAYCNRGNAKGDLERHAEAIEDYDQALRLDPDDALYYVNRGLAKQNLGRWLDAMADYDQALRLDPNHALAYNNRGSAKWNLERPEEAIADYDQALRLDSDLTIAYNNRGHVKAALERHAEAIADFDQVLRLDPDNAKAYNSRGWSKDQLERHEEAIADYNQALRLDPGLYLAYTYRGNAKVDLKRHAEAITDYDKALSLNPNSVSTYINRANTKADIDRHEEAIADYDQAVRIDPKKVFAYFGRGMAKGNLGRHAEAIADYDMVLRLDPSYAAAYNNRGVAKGKMGLNKEAMEDYNQALRLAPNSSLYRNNLKASRQSP